MKRRITLEGGHGPVERRANLNISMPDQGDIATMPIESASLHRRQRMPELMDQPGLEANAHLTALRGLSRLNRLSRASVSLWNAVQRTVEPTAGRPLRILDVATGGGDVLRGVARLAAKSGVVIEGHGIDRSAVAIEHAVAQTGTDLPVTFSVADALADPLPSGYEVGMTSLFCHHLPQASVIDLLQRLAASTRVVVISDLRRTQLGLFLAEMSCRSVTRSPIVHVDGPRSVRSAFTIDEFRELASQAGLHGMVVRPVWPQRFLAVWRRGDSP